MTSLLPASKFTFDPQNSKWVRERVRVQIAKHPFAQGGMRVVYRMREFDERENNGEYIECVAKKFKPDCEEKQYYYDEAMTQMVCESYAQEFNRRGTGYYLGFLPVSVLRLDMEGLLYNTEPYLRGDYLKHNDNSGHVDTKQLVPQAFSHFTYEASNQTLIVVDIQGVGDYYTDPQIHSFNGDGFGLGNLGQSGIRKFLQTHKCNRICRMLNLTDPKKGKQKEKLKETDAEMARRLQEEELRSAPEYKQKVGWTSQRYTQEIGKLEKMMCQVVNDKKANNWDQEQQLRNQSHKGKKQSKPPSKPSSNKKPLPKGKDILPKGRREKSSSREDIIPRQKTQEELEEERYLRDLKRIEEESLKQYKLEQQRIQNSLNLNKLSLSGSHDDSKEAVSTC